MWLPQKSFHLLNNKSKIFSYWNIELDEVFYKYNLFLKKMFQCIGDFHHFYHFGRHKRKKKNDFWWLDSLRKSSSIIRKECITPASKCQYFTLTNVCFALSRLRERFLKVCSTNTSYFSRPLIYIKKMPLPFRAIHSHPTKQQRLPQTHINYNSNVHLFSDYEPYL